MSYTLLIDGRLIDLSVPKVMGIVNCTPDSFYSRWGNDLDEVPDIVDIGAYSTRPGHEVVTVDEEKRRLRLFFESQQFVRYKDCAISVDTFRSDVARMCVEEYGVHIINDVSGGADPEMFKTAGELRVAYILTGNKNEGEKVTTEDLILGMIRKVQQLRSCGVNDIVIDPGFGFGRTWCEDYELLYDLEKFQILNLPVLVGVSRKSMIQKVLDCTPAEALNGTTVLNTIALMRGANILRVHDVKAARECVKLGRWGINGSSLP